jgi:hypothetical protein
MFFYYSTTETTDRIVSYDNHVATKGRRGFDWKKRSQKRERG